MPRPASMDRETAEEMLGPAEDFVINSDNRAVVRKWAVALGMKSVVVYKMSNVELANLYHEHGPGRNERLVSIPQNPPPVPVFDPEAVRQIVREELEKLPREVVTKLEVTTPRGTVTIAGSVHYKTDAVIRVAAIGHPIMLVGPAGCGKTTIGEHAAKALQLPFYITSTVIDTHELMGFVDGHGVYHRTPFREAYENGGVWVADEIDAWDAAALLTANSALANGIATFPDSHTPVKRHPDFRMIATANTFGHGADRVYIGRNELDAASLDRFAVIAIDYDTTLEQALSNGNPLWLNRVWQVREQVQSRNIRHVVSTRAIINGSIALSVGIPQREVEEMYLFKGMSKSDREKIR
jgi:cobaltochelatase CobS